MPRASCRWPWRSPSGPGIGAVVGSFLISEAFVRVIWPLSLPGVFAGSILVFIPTLGDYVNVELLGNPQTQMIGNVIQNRFLQQNDYPLAAALSFILMAAILVAIFVYARVLGTEELTGGRGMSGASELAVPEAKARAARRTTGLQTVDRWVVPVFTAAALLYLLVPILVMIAFSFNDPPGRFNFVWGEFSLAAWLNPFGRPGLQEALVTSLDHRHHLDRSWRPSWATLIALALTRYQFRGRAATNLFLFIPMATPEIVLGASLLTMFVGTAQEPFRTLTGGLLFPLGVQTILIAHVMFNISFVVVTVRARMQGFPRHLEEAAMDLGANEWTTFWKVTFPLILPGILAGRPAVPSRCRSTTSSSPSSRPGTEQTFPIWVWASIRNNLPPQIHVIGTMVFAGRGRARRPEHDLRAPRRAARPAHRPRGGGPGGRRAPGGPGMTTIDRPAETGCPSPPRPRGRAAASGAASRTSTSTAARARG